MNARILSTLIALFTVVPAPAAETLDAALAGTAAEYRERVARAAEELNRTRTRIADERAPLLEQVRAAENRILAAESESRRIQIGAERSNDDRRKLLVDFDAIRKTTTYLTTLANESLKAARDGMAPGEEQFHGDRFAGLQQQIDAPAAGPSAQSAMDAVEFLLARTEQALGGYRADGSAMVAETSEVREGTFAFVGPETYFRPAAGGVAGAVRPREGSTFPVTYALPAWKPEDAAAFFAGQPGMIVADASGGKALRLRETTGSWLDHVRKGGVVAYAIVAVGLLAFLMILQKVRDLGRMAVDTPATVESFLDIVASGATGEAEARVKTLKRTTRELFVVGLRHADQPKPILEERLQAVLLEQRLHYERRLPLLAVIATAAPLMGLLGTVVGMVKTFALITVFGTGNAGKLSSGISEVLVATELGLAVAIPTLVAHGFLAHRIQKNLSLLERYALQFTTAVETARVDARGEPQKESVTA